MTDTRDGTEESGTDSPALGAVGIYEEDESVVFYHTENPLAWVQSGVSVSLEEAV